MIRVVFFLFKKRSKRFKKNFDYVKFLKFLCFGDGKKKWIILVYNGVIFLLLYEFYGSKILYKGKLVNLFFE